MNLMNSPAAGAKAGTRGLVKGSLTWHRTASLLVFSSCWSRSQPWAQDVHRSVQCGQWVTWWHEDALSVRQATSEWSETQRRNWGVEAAVCFTSFRDQESKDILYVFCHPAKRPTQTIYPPTECVSKPDMAYVLSQLHEKNTEKDPRKFPVNVHILYVIVREVFIYIKAICYLLTMCHWAPRFV